MRRAPAIVLVVLLGFLLPALFGSGVAGATTHPTLRLMDSDAVTLRGTGFKRHEHVRVLVHTTTSAAKAVVATSTGGFVVTFSGLHVTACAGFIATAVGSDGSRASFKRAPGMCPVE